jgi:hypothetical protein
MKTIVELTFKMNLLMEMLDIKSATEFERRYQVTDEAVKNLSHDTWQELSRKDLFALFTAAAEVSPDKRFQLLVARPHPLWKTFVANGVAVILPAVNDKGAEIEESTGVLGVLTSLTGVLRKNAPDAITRDPMSAIRLMETENVISIGAPMFNRTAGVVLSELLHRERSVIRPFDGTRENSLRSPFEHRLSTKGQLSNSPFYREIDTDTPYGVTLRSRDRNESVHLPLTSPSGKATKGWDIGVLIARRYPSADPKSKRFTTIAVGGQSWFATAEVAREIATGRVYLGEKAFDHGYVERYLLCEWERTGIGPQFSYRPSHRMCRWFTYNEATDVRSQLTAKRSPGKPAAALDE